MSIKDKVTRLNAAKDKGQDIARANKGGIPRNSEPASEQGIVPSASSKLIKKSSLSSAELRAINFWKESNGDLVSFINLCGGNKTGKELIPLLLTDRVCNFIEQECKNGLCLPLVASKREIEFYLSNMVRNGGDKLNSMGELNRLRGNYPKNSGDGGTVVQIVITGGLV